MVKNLITIYHFLKELKGEVTSGIIDLFPRIASLFNNEMYSDVEFVFPGSVLYGHQLIIALRSNYFASIFCQNKKTVLKVTLPEEKRELYYCLLRFIYTDKVEFEGVAMEDLYTIANQYGIQDLASKCRNYLVDENITIDSIFSKYEYALSKDIDTILRECRNFVCHNAEPLFKSFYLENVRSELLEDILKQDDLSLSSEEMIIKAVLRWCENKCKEDKLPVNDKNLRECIFPFLKYLRFLTLSATQFQNIVKKYNIFTGFESTLLTCKILQLQCDVNVPEYICGSNQKRGKFISNIASPPLFFIERKEHHKFSTSKNRKKSNLYHKEPLVRFCKHHKII